MIRDGNGLQRLSRATLVWLALLPTGMAIAGSAAAAPPRAAHTGPFEINITHGLGAGEPELAIDAVHHTLVISFDYSNPPDGSPNQGCGVAVSRDGGNTWRVQRTYPADPGPTPGNPYHQCSDPTAAAGPGGTVYVGGGWWDQPGGGVDYYNMYASRSTDGGFTWGPSVFATGDNDLLVNLLLGKNSGHSDREFLAVDNQTGTLYASAADFPRARRWVVASHDQGRTFGPPRAIDSADAPELPNDYIPAAAHGVLAVNYLASGTSDGGCPCRSIFETSRDDGVTWTRHTAPVAAQWTAADPSRPGRFAIMSGQGFSDTSLTPDALVVSVTSDYGRTWSKPVQVGQDPPNSRYEPWVNYSPTGVLGVGYKTEYGASCAPVAGCSGGSYDFWAAISRDGGSSFGAPVRISHAMSSAEPGGGDDFSFVGLDKNYLYTTWADMRKSPGSAASGQRTLYFGRVPLNTPTAKQLLLACKPGTPRNSRLACRARPVGGTLRLSGVSARATISRKGTVYATGRAVRGRRGGLRILVTQSRALLPGSYTLRIRISRRAWISRRIQITRACASRPRSPTAPWAGSGRRPPGFRPSCS